MLNLHRKIRFKMLIGKKPGNDVIKSVRSFFLMLYHGEIVNLLQSRSDKIGG